MRNDGFAKFSFNLKTAILNALRTKLFKTKNNYPKFTDYEYNTSYLKSQEVFIKNYRVLLILVSSTKLSNPKVLLATLYLDFSNISKGVYSNINSNKKTAADFSFCDSFSFDFPHFT